MMVIIIIIVEIIIIFIDLFIIKNFLIFLQVKIKTEIIYQFTMVLLK